MDYLVHIPVWPIQDKNKTKIKYFGVAPKLISAPKLLTHTVITHDVQMFHFQDIAKFGILWNWSIQCWVNLMHMLGGC